ncbi:MAG: HAD family hydrolase [Candidatus Baltobacteraceae bacterium]
MEPHVGIGFDLDHTLAIDNKLERVAFLRLLEALLERGGRTLGTLADEIGGIDRLLVRQRAGEFSIEDAVRLFVSEHGVAPSESQVEWFVSAAVRMVPEFVVPLPGAKRTLAALRERGVAIAVLSNGWNPLQRRKAEQAGFDGPLLVSAELGVQKPDRGAFEALLARLGTEPDQTWYVGDDPIGDVAGAAQAGLRAVWIDWEEKTYPPDLAPPARTITALDELLEIVPEPVRLS